ncbi:MAG: DUF6266 family protein [Bacteroidota bacterium]|nr:DUF6266 family protein [Bacteroidota bacterium]
MARISNGILGEFVGTAGNVSGYVRHGQNFLRSLPRKSDKAMGPKRLAQQQKIKVCNAFTTAFTGTGFFNTTFPAYGATGSGYNRATSALMNRAVVGSYPNTAIAWPKVLVSKGPLPCAEYAGIAQDNEGNIIFSWTDNTGTGTAKENDKVILVAWFPELQQAIFSRDAALRSGCFTTLAAGAFKGYLAETWIGFISNDEKDASDSVYTGSVRL